MSDRVLELATRRSRVLEEIALKQQELTAVESELAASLGVLAPRPTPPEAPVKAGRPGRKKKATPAVASSKKSDYSSLKDLVLDILTAHPDGMVLNDIVAAVKEMIRLGSYKSSATKLAPLVSQAVLHLKDDHKLQIAKNDASRNVYSVSVR